MKVFLSWSGEASKAAALILHSWLPSVIYTLKPYMSAESIEKGQRWSVNIAQQLEETHFGIICVTPGNITAPWILFEAGALSKSMENAKVSPILFGLSPSDLRGSPLLQFQSTEFKKEDIKKLLESLNSAEPEGSRLSIDILSVSFERAWKELEEKISRIDFAVEPELQGIEHKSNLPIDKIESVLEELLTISRSQIKTLRSPTDILPPEYLRQIFKDAERRSDRYIDVMHPAWTAIGRKIEIIKSEFSKEKYEDGVLTDLIERESLAKIILPLIDDIERHINHLRRRRREWPTHYSRNDPGIDSSSA